MNSLRLFFLFNLNSPFEVAIIISIVVSSASLSINLRNVSFFSSSNSDSLTINKMTRNTRDFFSSPETPLVLIVSTHSITSGKADIKVFSDTILMPLLAKKFCTLSKMFSNKLSLILYFI